MDKNTDWMKCLNNRIKSQVDVNSVDQFIMAAVLQKRNKAKKSIKINIDEEKIKY